VTSILLANVSRRPGRTAFTALGIALGVATIVALLSLGAGLKKTAGGLVHLGDSDFAVFQHGVEDPTASFLPESAVRKVAKVPGVATAVPIMLLVEKIKPEPEAIVFGTTPQGSMMQRLVMLGGHRPTNAQQTVLGDILARRMHKRIGDTVTIGDRRETVVGIYHVGQFFVDSGAVLRLRVAQGIVQRPDEITTVAVQIAPSAHTKVVAKAVAKALPGTDVIANPEEAARAGANGQLVHKTVLLLVAVALIIGGIGVTNTMAMAVLERARELALMSAVGWSPRQVGGLVVAEGVVVSFLGAAVGLLLGVLGAGGLTDALGVSSVVSPDVTAGSMARGLAIGIAIGVLGGLYPAWRVSRLPAEDLLTRGA
jgi:putative ABC transport system permease protein